MMKKILFYISFIFLPVIIFAGSLSITDSVSTPVEDNTCFDRTFDIPISSTITDVLLEISIDHTWRADLDITLTSPSGTIVNITRYNGGNSDNLYVEFNDTTTDISIVDDNSNHTLPVVPRKPEQLFSSTSVIGEDSLGIWTLTVCDDAGADTGTYNYATLTIYNADPTQPPIIQAIPNQLIKLDNTVTFDLSAYIVETDGDPIISYGLDGTLPSGLSFDSTTGIISGTPTIEETQVLTLFATDADGESTGESFSITVYPPSPLVDYRMDECFWYNSSAIVGDVKDDSLFGNDATSYISAQTNVSASTPPLCNVGVFNGADSYLDTPNNAQLTTTNNYTISAWVNPALFSNTYEVLIAKTTDYYDGFTFYTYWDGTDVNTAQIRLLTGNGANPIRIAAPISANIWTHVVASYDGATLRIYINGVKQPEVTASRTILNADTPLLIGKGLGTNFYYNGLIDEVKLYDYTLTDVEVQDIYNNEFAGTNYDGTPRTCNTCSATVTAGVWELIGIPAELRGGTYTVADIIGDDITTPYGSDWRVYSRGYSDTNNSSWDNYLDLTSSLEFGKGYWLRSIADATWNANDIEAVDYNSTSPDCPTARCVELDIQSVILEYGVDDLLGTGRYRYNMTGAVGKKPVNWADCRLLVDGVAYTPTDANASGFMSKQIWQYDPSSSNADLKGYTTCDDTTPGGCQLIPYKGFWIELHGPTKGKVLKLLVPEE
ncbi:MAG TPA: hypothetical protein EYG82_01775 [Sulfurovum sp.]|nr:hypothetical protein [Sulfurovum sp.]